MHPSIEYCRTTSDRPLYLPLFVFSIGKVNQMSAGDLLSPFNDLSKFTPEKRQPLLAALL
jgi:hypothetical protein